MKHLLFLFQLCLILIAASVLYVGVEVVHLLHQVTVGLTP